MRPLLALSILALSATPALAQEQPNILTMPDGQALLHISATEQQEVEQDLLVASVRYETENKDSGIVQDEINKAMKKALEASKKVEDVKSETTQYNIFKTTVPRTKEQVWRGSQGLQLKSTDAEKLLKLTGELQNMGFVTSGLNYTISPERAAKIQDEMMEAALAKLKTRADRAAKALGKSGTDLIEVHVNGGHIPSPVSMYRGAQMEVMAMKADIAPPVASAGEQTLSLNVSATALIKP